MPIYEYFCEQCDFLDEYFLPINHETPTCDKCDTLMQRRVSITTFRLKGGCWSKDGYSGGGGYKPGEALRTATEGAKQDLSNTMDKFDKKSKA
jgi:putative FmdB family regulatory protein